MSLALLLTRPCAAAASPATRQDWGQYNAGYRGDPDSRTPAVDALAAEGLVLERLCVVAAADRLLLTAAACRRRCCYLPLSVCVSARWTLTLSLSLGCFAHGSYVHKWCAPTRSALMTGRNPMHTGLDPLNFTSTIEKRGGDSSLSADYIFIPRLLQSAGYESHMLGKVRPHATPHSV